MIEVEIKAPLVDRDKVKARIMALGGQYIDRQVQKDIYFNSRDRDFAASDEALRVRSSGGGAVLTYKGPRIGTRSKSRREIEVGITDVAAAEEFLAALGFTRLLCITKTRENYRLDRYVISLDTVEGLGDYLEIETRAETEHEVKSKVEEMIGLLPAIGVGEGATITSSYLEMLLEKMR